ncbi:MAG: SH3 domain-containing protein [Mariprofundus sp.]|nr:SH3 domain-containing protein [Mariprofundus sp.]
MAVSAIPGAMYGMVADQFSGEEESFASSMRLTLAATQRSLQTMRLNIDVLEFLDDGYAIAFNNNKLDGKINLKKQTGRLTTVYVKVRATVREDSVERVIIEMIKAELKKLPANARLRRSNLHNLRAKPDIQSKRLGWYRPGAKLDAHRIGTKGWLKIKMPSGKMAYLKGLINKQK